MSHISLCLVITFGIISQTLDAIPLSILPWNEQVASRDLQIINPKGAEKVGNMDSTRRTKDFQVSTDAESPSMIQASDKMAADGKPTTLAIKVPAGITRALLLLLPDEKSPTGLRGLVIDDSLTGFKWGTTRLINTCGKPTVFGWGKNRIRVPQSWTPINVSLGSKVENIGVVLYLEENPKEPIYSAVWEHRDIFRQLVFIVPSADLSRGAIDFKFIVEDQRDLKLKATKEE